MPSFRDIKGRPIDEFVSSRDVPPNALPDDGEGEIDVDAAVAATKARLAAANQRIVPMPAPALEETIEPRVQVLPDDFESGLKALEATIQEMKDRANQLLLFAVEAGKQMEALRARAEKDAKKLAILKTLQE